MQKYKGQCPVHFGLPGVYIGQPCPYCVPSTEQWIRDDEVVFVEVPRPEFFFNDDESMPCMYYNRIEGWYGISDYIPHSGRTARLLTTAAYCFQKAVCDNLPYSIFTYGVDPSWFSKKLNKKTNGAFSAFRGLGRSWVSVSRRELQSIGSTLEEFEHWAPAGDHLFNHTVFEKR